MLRHWRHGICFSSPSWTESATNIGHRLFPSHVAARQREIKSDYDAGLRETARVLRRGGECGILDFGEPGGFIGKLYRVYFKHVLPKVGTVISGVKGPYAYLPASVERFPRPDELLERMRKAGFQNVSWTPYTFGIAGLYRGRKR